MNDLIQNTDTETLESLKQNAPADAKIQATSTEVEGDEEIHVQTPEDLN